MGFFSQRVDRSEIVKGDHLYTYRKGNSFSHHGIYVGNDEVVHFCPRELSDFIVALIPNSCMISTPSLEASSCSEVSLDSRCDCGYRKPKNSVVLSCLDCFLSGGSLYRYKYDCRALTTIVKRGGTSTTAKSDEPELVVSRAMHLLSNSFGDYDPIENNCEDFALYCKTSLRIINYVSPGGSGQVIGLSCVRKAIRDSCALMIVPTCAAIASSAVLAPIGTVIGAGLYSRYRYKSDLGVRKDVVKVDVVDLVPYRCPKAAKEPTKEP